MNRRFYKKFKLVIDFILKLNIKSINSYLTASIYDDFFYEQFDRVKQKTAEDIAKIVVEILNPKNVFDIGCGTGLYISEMSKFGISVLGCDSSGSAIKLSCDDVTIFLADVSKPLILNRKYDLVLCIEVAEHLHEKYAEQLVINCASNGNKVLFTSAPPGQGGIGHINERPYEYWINKFKNHGFRYDVATTNEIKKYMRERDVIWWISENAMLFVSSDIV